MMCDAILRWEDTPYFVMCDLEENHKSSHTALNHIWDGLEEVHPKKEHDFHMNAFKKYLELRKKQWENQDGKERS